VKKGREGTREKARTRREIKKGGMVVVKLLGII
jgi:hypothetical protein